MRPPMKRHEVVQPLDTNIRFIPLTQRQTATVDAEEYVRLTSGHSWCAWKQRGTYYAQTRTKQKIVLMHRMVMNAPDGVEVDHINHDTLDNRKANLRFASRGENRRNTRIGVRNTTGFKGVYRSKKSKKRPWEAYITLDYRHTTLGHYATPEEAARRYDQAAVEHFGEFANLNFPAEEQ